MNNKIIITTVGIALVVVAGMFFLQKTEAGTPSENIVDYSDSVLAEFATCITDSGAKFYGAFWCSHCHNQKQAFGNAMNFLPYVECSTLDKKSQTEACKEAGITSYPTWVFGDGTILTGELPFDILEENTGCTAPQE